MMCIIAQAPCQLVNAGHIGLMKDRHTRRFGLAPSLAEIEALALSALARLPEPFAAHVRDVALLIEDFADDATLGALGIGRR